jgi:hypothetical protein
MSLVNADTHVRHNLVLPGKDVDVQTDERLLRNIEDYLMELVFVVENIEEVNLIADVLASVRDALRDLADKSAS